MDCQNKSSFDASGELDEFDEERLALSLSLPWASWQPSPPFPPPPSPPPLYCILLFSCNPSSITTQKNLVFAMASPPIGNHASASTSIGDQHVLIESSSAAPSTSNNVVTEAASNDGNGKVEVALPVRNRKKASANGRDDVIEPPFPWATNRKATVHGLDDLFSKGIRIIEGEQQCTKCNNRTTVGYDLVDKFREVANFVTKNKHLMHDRAPPIWNSPALPECTACKEKEENEKYKGVMKSVISDNNESINWLFMLLGQTLGCCSLEQLKFFCQHSNRHRTGAKDQVLYNTYLGLLKQLDPTGPFD